MQLSECTAAVICRHTHAFPRCRYEWQIALIFSYKRIMNYTLFIFV